MPKNQRTKIINAYYLKHLEDGKAVSPTSDISEEAFLKPDIEEVKEGPKVNIIFYILSLNVCLLQYMFFSKNIFAPMKEVS